MRVAVPAMTVGETTVQDVLEALPPEMSANARAIGTAPEPTLPAQYYSLNEFESHIVAVHYRTCRGDGDPAGTRFAICLSVSSWK